LFHLRILGQVVHTLPLFTKQQIGTGASWELKQASTRHTSPVSVDLQLRLVSGWELLRRRSAPPNGPLWLGKDFRFRLGQLRIT